MGDYSELFRMSFIIQDNATMTLESNLVKLVEIILLDGDKSGFSLSQISVKIESNFSLFFTEEEINRAIQKKGKNIQVLDGKYLLKPEYRDKLARKENFKSQLDKFAILAIKELKLKTEKSELVRLLTDYLYFCFNSNKNSILNLINDSKVAEISFSRNYDEIKLINDFLSWDNDDKNKFVYNVVSFGYVYCTLTVKKNNLLSNRLFRGKKFILDSNIIFRLAGINNDSRKRTIKSFVQKCKEVGVELCYTTTTFDEIKRVIINRVEWIKSVTGEQRPLDLSSYEPNGNDFYLIYCVWAAQGANQYNDFVAFEKYLTKLIMAVIDQLKCINSINFQIKQRKEFETFLLSLSEYKAKHSNKTQSQASLSTDVTNILHVKDLRAKSANDNIWSTNVFFISADQNLIRWISEIETGMPLAVLPSVWLTIMLRFSGRTSDDYKAFCSFLELKSIQKESELDVYELLQNLSDKTDNNELKQLIVQEVFENKNQYIDIAKGDYEKVVEKAYDIITEKTKKQYELELSKIKKESDEKEKNIQNYETQKVIDNEFRIARLVGNDCRKHFRIIFFVNRIKYILGVVFFVLLVVDTYNTLHGSGCIYNILSYVLPEAVNGTGNCLSALGIIWAILVAAAGFVLQFIFFLSSEKRVENYKMKREIYYKRLLDVD